MKGLWRALFLGLFVGLTLTSSSVRADDAKAKGKEQFWEGKLAVRPGVEIRLFIRAVESGKGEITATLDSPDEGLQDLQLSSVAIDKSRLAFELKVSASKYEGTMNKDGTQATGTWKQRGAELAAQLREKGQGAPAAESRGPGTALGRKAERRRRDRAPDRAPCFQDRHRRDGRHLRQPGPGPEGTETELGHRWTSRGSPSR